MKIYDCKLVAFFSGRDYYSNFYKSIITYTGKTFHCGEALFMYIKALYFEDYYIADKILNSSNDPVLCKTYGKRVRNYNDETWSNVRYDVMMLVVLLKLRQNSHIRDHYLELIDKGYEFVEASPYDRIYGCGLSEDNINITNKHKWMGKNLLGKIYNEVHKIIFNDDINNLGDVISYNRTKILGY